MTIIRTFFARFFPCVILLAMLSSIVTEARADLIKVPSVRGRFECQRPGPGDHQRQRRGEPRLW